MKKINLQNIFKKQPINSLSISSVPWPGNISRDWKIMVYVFAIGLAFLSLFAWKIYLSDQIAGGYFTPESTTSSVSVKTLSLKKIQADLLLMQNKKATFMRLRTNPPKVVDPAI